VTTDDRQLERVALDAATNAAQFVMEGFQRQMKISTKEYGELFTDYDVGSEERVRAALEKATPGVPIVGEEGGGQPGDDLTWYIDPIDGTVNFIAGHPWFGISVGILKGDEPLAGAVVAPALGLSWSGSAKHGSQKNGQPCHVNHTARLADTVVTTGFPDRRGTNAGPGERRAMQHLKVLQTVRDVRRCGSAAVDLCMVASGTYSVYWLRKLSHWDTAAGAAIVLGAGGHWLVREHTQEDVATNGLVDEEFLTLIDGVLTLSS